MSTRRTTLRLRARQTSCARLALTLALGLAPAACASTFTVAPELRTAARVHATERRDVDKVNLPAADELRELEKGTPELGVPARTIRVAVIPVHGEDPWLTEAVAERIAQSLSTLDGVSVAERYDLTFAAKETARKFPTGSALAALGRELGAVVVIAVRADADGDALALSLRAARTDVEWHPEMWRRSLASVMDPAALDVAIDLAARAGLPGAPRELATSALSRQALELVSRARVLKYEHRDVEALALFERALPEASRYVRVEADFVRTLGALSLDDDESMRASAVLAMIPLDAKTACAHAVLGARRLWGRARDPEAVTKARQLVRVAASCGDARVLAAAMAAYASVHEGIDLEVAGAAWARAGALLANSEHDPLSSFIAYRRYYFEEYWNQKWHGERSANFARLAGALERAGEARIALYALAGAATTAVATAERRRYAERASKLAKPMGGNIYASRLVEAAGIVRDAGEYTRATTELRAAMMSVLERLRGAEPGAGRPELPLFDEFGSPSPSPVMTSVGKYVAAAERHALATLLREWASWKRIDVPGHHGVPNRADEYDAIVRALEGDARKLLPDDPAMRLDRQLADAGIALEVILGAEEPPLRTASIRTVDAFSALADRWDAASDERHVIAMQRVAEWAESPRLVRQVRRAKAKYLAPRNSDRALELMADALDGASDDPAWTELILFDESFHFNGLGAARRRVPFAALTSITELVNAEAREGYLTGCHAASTCAKHGAKAPAEVPALLAKMRGLAASLTSRGEHRGAAHALTRAVVYARSLDETAANEASVGLYEARVAVLDAIHDPVQSIRARLDLAAVMEAAYARDRERDRERERGSDRAAAAGAAKTTAFADEPSAVKLGAEIGGLLEALAATQPLDAAMLAGEVQSGLREKLRLVPRAIKWLEDARPTPETAEVLGGLYRIQYEAPEAPDSVGATDREKSRRDAKRNCIDAYRRARAPKQLHAVMLSFLASDGDEAEVLSDLAACMEAAGDTRGRVAACVDATGSAAAKLRTPISSRAAFSAALARGADITEENLERNEKLPDRYAVHLAVLAAAVGDEATFRRFTADIGEEQASQISDDLGRVNVKLLGELYLRFAKSSRASRRWKMRRYPNVVESLYRAGEKDAASTLYQEGLTLVRQDPYSASPLPFLRYEVLRFTDAKDWNALDTMLEHAAKDDLDRVTRILELQLSRALARASQGNIVAASAVLAPLVKRAQSAASRTHDDAAHDRLDVLPCHGATVLEVAASFELAAGRCDAGAAYQKQAASARVSCVGEAYGGGSRHYGLDGPSDARWIAPNLCRGADGGWTKLLLSLRYK